MDKLLDSIEKIILDSILHSKKVIRWPYSQTIDQLEQLVEKGKKEVLSKLLDLSAKNVQHGRESFFVYVSRLVDQIDPTFNDETIEGWKVVNGGYYCTKHNLKNCLECSNEDKSLEVSPDSEKDKGETRGCDKCGDNGHTAIACTNQKENN